jgi:hypothetical protein
MKKIVLDLMSASILLIVLARSKISDSVWFSSCRVRPGTLHLISCCDFWVALAPGWSPLLPASLQLGLVGLQFFFYRRLLLTRFSFLTANLLFCLVLRSAW